MQEVWKDVKGYENLYQVSNFGRVRSLDRVVRNKNNGVKIIRGRIMSQHLVGHGYYHIVLSKDGKIKGHLVHRLVAQTFIPNPQKLPQVNHKDENKLNNNIDNLEWCDSTYNNNYGTVKVRHSLSQLNHISSSKPVKMLKNDKTIQIFPSISEATRVTGCKRQGVYACCKGIQKHHKGYQWQYIRRKKMSKSKFQKGEIKRLKRSELIGAEYNPRIIDKEAKRKLKKNLQEHGLVSPITYNKRTNHIVSGHQRVSQLDALEKNQDYELDVWVIDVPVEEEAKLNVLLNNQSLMGDWDLDKLAEMTEEFDINFDDMGFSKLDVDFMFDGDDRFSDMFETPEAEEVKQGLEKVKEARQAGKERMQDKNNINFYSILVFEDEAAKAEFYKKINVPISEEYLTADKVYRLER